MTVKVGMRSLRARDVFKYHQKRENMTKEDPTVLKKNFEKNGQNWPVKKIRSIV